MFPHGPDAERRHEPGPERLWSESWYLDFANADATVGGYIRLGLYPTLGVSWYWACLVRAGEPLVTVIEHQAPIPRMPGLELRTSGLWSEIIVESPYDHVTVGLEAFGVAPDHPSAMYDKGWGDRVPLGFDLEWETAGAPFAYGITDRYEVPCVVHGEILVGQDTIEFDGFGQRDHSWGPRDWWSFDWCWTAGRFDDDTPFHSFASADLGWSTGYLGRDAAEVTNAFVTSDHDEHGFATGARLDLDGFEIGVVPKLWSPVLLTGPDPGQVARLPRALSRFTASDGRQGAGWIEFNQVQRPAV